MIEYAAGGTHKIPVFFSLAGIGYSLHSQQQNLDLLVFSSTTASAAARKVN
jgi:hypothetical protein